jgi:hypothetical protein
LKLGAIGASTNGIIAGFDRRTSAMSVFLQS